MHRTNMALLQWEHLANYIIHASWLWSSYTSQDSFSFLSFPRYRSVIWAPTMCDHILHFRTPLNITVIVIYQNPKINCFKPPSGNFFYVDDKVLQMILRHVCIYCRLLWIDTNILEYTPRYLQGIAMNKVTSSSTHTITDLFIEKPF